MRKRHKKTFTLIELVMTMVIASIVLVPLSVVIYESVINTFLPEYYTIASTLLEQETERIQAKRFPEVLAETVSFTGSFSDYTSTVSFYYVTGAALNTESMISTDYKRVKVIISRSGFPSIEGITLVTDN